MKRSATHSPLLLILMAIILSTQFGATRAFALANESRQLPDELSWRDDSVTDVTCEEAQRNAGGVKVGMREAEVLKLLGEPKTRLENEWVYNFWSCAPRPQVGQQIVMGLDIIFTEGAVKQIKYATLDAIGPAPNSAPAKKKNRSPQSARPARGR